VTYLVMESCDGSAPDLYRTMLLIVVPLVMLAFTTTGLQGWRRHRAAQHA